VRSRCSSSPGYISRTPGELTKYLYPSLSSLFGDCANISYLEKCDPSIEVVRTNVNDEPYFVNNVPDLIYMGSMTESSQEIITEKLTPYKDRIEELIDKGVYFLITGNALEVFGKDTFDEKGGLVFTGLGIFDTNSKRDMLHRFNSIYIGQYEDIEVVGFKTQFGHSYYNEGFKDVELFNTIRSVGFNPDESREGIRRNNFMATYLVGPFLVMNPLFTNKLLKNIGSDKTCVFEPALMDAYNDRVKEFKDPKTGMYY